MTVREHGLSSAFASLGDEVGTAVVTSDHARSPATLGPLLFVVRCGQQAVRLVVLCIARLSAFGRTFLPLANLGGTAGAAALSIAGHSRT